MGTGMKLIIFLLLAAAIGLGAATYYAPTEVKVDRAILVKGPIESAYGYVGDFNRSREWQSWGKATPAVSSRVTGEPGVIGQKLILTRPDSGTETFELIEAEPYGALRIKAVSTRYPNATIHVTLKEEGGKVRVAYSFFGPLGANPLNRLAGYWDRMRIDGELSEDLTRLVAAIDNSGTSLAGTPGAGEPDPDQQAQDELDKALNDKEPQPTPVPSDEQVAKDPDLMTIDERPILYVSTRAAANDQSGTAKALGDAYNALINYIQRHNLEVSGAPLAITTGTAENGDRLFDAAIPLASKPEALPEAGAVKLGSLPAGRAIMKVHKGPYTTMAATYQRIRDEMKTKGLKEGARSWEEYVTDAGEVDEAELLTNVYILVE